MLDEDQLATGEWIRAHTAPKAVMLHGDIHITPSDTVAGRPTLVAYNGWMWSHGLPYGDRDKDRRYILDNALKDSDAEAYGLMRRWGIRYVVGENMRTHHRPSEAAHQEALAREAAAGTDAAAAAAAAAAPGVPRLGKLPSPPTYDPDSYLSGQLKAVFRRGRFIVLEVQGYGPGG
jgi:hypothetical protein